MRRSVCFLADCDVFVTFCANLFHVHFDIRGVRAGRLRVGNELSLNRLARTGLSVADEVARGRSGHEGLAGHRDRQTGEADGEAGEQV